MFKVGMGEIPEIPSTLSEEGVDFLECCLIHDPQERWTAIELLEHTNFCKVSMDNDCDCDDDKKSKKKNWSSDREQCDGNEMNFYALLERKVKQKMC